MTYRPEIDGLRSVAVGSVILYHTQISIFGLQLFKGGFIGVDIFFVISGYLISSIIFKELVTTGSFSFKYFYERRVRRILPVLLFVMLVSLPFAWLYLLPSSLIDFSKSIIYSLGFISNFYFYLSGQEYGAQDGLFKPFLHTWSLSIEEQFYLIFPIIILVIYKFLRKHLFFILFASFLLSLGFADFVSQKNLSLSFFFIHTRIWELLAGSILAYFEIKLGRRGKKNFLNLILPLIGFILIGYSLIYFNDEMLHPSFLTLAPIIGVSLIIWFSNKDEVITKILSSKLFVGIGLISYSLYIWHYPIFAFYRYVYAEGSFLAEFLIIISLFVLSILSYFFIEKKFRDKNFDFKNILYYLFFCTFLVLSINFYFIYKKGFPDKAVIDGIHLDRNFYVEEISNWENEYYYQDNLTDYKSLVTVVGDSHAKNFAMLFQSNKKLFSDYYFIPLDINKFNQIFLSEKIENDLDHLVKNSDIIIFSYLYDENKFLKVKNTIKDIKEKSNKKIILTTNNPSYNLYASRFTDLDFFLIKNKRKPNYDELLKLENKYYKFIKNNNEYNYYNDKLIKLANTNNIKLLNKSLYQCNDLTKRCEVLTDKGRKINWDNNHHTFEGAKYLGKKINKLNWLKLD